MIVVHARYACCTRCREFKPRTAFYRLRTRPDSWCKTCRCRAQAERVARAKADPESMAKLRAQRAATARKWRAKHPERERAARRAYEQRRSADPQRMAARAEAARMNYRIRVGGEVRRSPRRHYRAPSNHDERMDAAPLVAWLARTFPGWSALDVAIACRANEKRLRELLRGERDWVTLYVADAILTGYGRPDLLNVLYPVEP